MVGPRSPQLHEPSSGKEGGISIEFEHLFGFKSEKNRQSLFYVHEYQSAAQGKMLELEEAKKGKLKQGESQAGQGLGSAERGLFDLDETHEGCRRYFLYHSGRLAIRECAQSRKQRAYGFHRNEITSIAVHPSKDIVCTCEFGSRNPTIHIWSALTMSLLHEIVARHHQFVCRSEFSRDGKQLVSLGGSPGLNSIEIHRWESEESVCFRLFERAEISDIKANPYNRDELAICGKDLLEILRVSNRTLICHEKAATQGKHVLCMTYTSSVYGTSIESDIITGNRDGDLHLFICGKYVACRRRAHNQPINCLRLC